MADLTDDPLADYDPGSPVELATGELEPAPPGAAPEYDEMPAHLAAIPDEAALAPDQWHEDTDAVIDPALLEDIEGSLPPAELAERDYLDGPTYPVEEHGTYAELYPEDAARLRQLRDRPDRPQAGTASGHSLGDLSERVQETLRACLAAMQDRNGEEMLALLSFFGGSGHVMDCVDEQVRKVYDRLAEVLISEYHEDRSRVVDLNDIPGIEATSAAVKAELAIIRSRVGRPGLPKTPSAEWKALVNYVQRMTARQRAMALVAAIDAGDTDESCMQLFKGLEPPTANRALQNADFSRTAKQWEEADAAAAAESASYRLSSGIPTLDYAYTQKDARGRDIEPRGAFSPGELHIVAAPTGNGKSACGRRLVTSVTEDLVVNWGHEKSKVLIAITEEAPKIVYTVAGMASGDQFHHLADNLVIANVGASRRRFIHSIWDCVIDAYHTSQATGMPISASGMPAFIVLDYVGGLVEDGEGADTTAIEKTANLMLRGLCGWDVEMMEEFSGESFGAYAGMSWPAGMDNFRPVVLGFAQFKKLADPQWYDPSGKKGNVSDFVVENADGSPGWEVRAGDFRVPTQTEIRGSGVLINHATSLIILHRSRPQKNPKIVDPNTGRIRLVDDRARWLLVKTRNGSDLPFIDMRFDSLKSGLRGQFFDRMAESAIAGGKLVPSQCYRDEGDPILPPRARRSAFDGVAY